MSCIIGLLKSVKLSGKSFYQIHRHDRFKKRENVEKNTK